MNLLVHTDGGARGNPGPAAVGVVIESLNSQNQTVKIREFGERIGETTNNVAEYLAVIAALEWLRNYPNPPDGGLTIQFYLDSTLLVNQLNGTFKVKAAKLRELLMRVRVLEQEVGGRIFYQLIPREKNRRADFLVNQALDK